MDSELTITYRARGLPCGGETCPAAERFSLYTVRDLCMENATAAQSRLRLCAPYLVWRVTGPG